MRCLLDTIFNFVNSSIEKHRKIYFKRAKNFFSFNQNGYYSKCNHANARFYAVQKFGGDKEVRLYNCSECHPTISEQSLREARKEPEYSRA